MKGGVFVAAILAVTLLVIPFSQALGLSYDYLEDNKLPLAPGEEYFFKLILQNDEDKELALEIKLESEVAELIGDPEIEVAAKTYDEFVYFHIEVPEDATPGEVYTVTYEVLPRANAEGQVPFTLKYRRGFEVTVIDNEAPIVEAPADIENVARKEAPWTTVALVLAIVVVLALIWNRSAQLTKAIKLPKRRIVTKKKEAVKETKPAPQQPEQKPAAPVQETAKPVQPTQQPVQQLAQPVVEPKPAPKEVKPKTPERFPNKFAAPEHAFATSSGITFHSTDELFHALHVLPEEVIHYHVNAERNDFSNWARGALKQPALADKLAKAQTREELINAFYNG